MEQLIQEAHLAETKLQQLNVGIQAAQKKRSELDKENADLAESNKSLVNTIKMAESQLNSIKSRSIQEANIIEIARKDLADRQLKADELESNLGRRELIIRDGERKIQSNPDLLTL